DLAVGYEVAPSRAGVVASPGRQPCTDEVRVGRLGDTEAQPDPRLANQLAPMVERAPELVRSTGDHEMNVRRGVLEMPGESTHRVVHRMRVVDHDEGGLVPVIHRIDGRDQFV